VVHINHGVRAKDADGDEAFVKALAEKMKIDFTSEKFKISKASENNLREKRYEILFKVKKKEGASVIFTAHHRDDLLETRLMSLT
jgi:tRNA(Ile)-lysidine synthase